MNNNISGKYKTNRSRTLPPSNRLPPLPITIPNSITRGPTHTHTTSPSLCVCECSDAWKRLAFQELKARATASAHKANLVCCAKPFAAGRLRMASASSEMRTDVSINEAACLPTPKRRQPLLRGGTWPTLARPTPPGSLSLSPSPSRFKNAGGVVSYRVATANYCVCASFRCSHHGIHDTFGAGSKAFKLKDAHRSVPQHCLCSLDYISVRLCGLRSNVEAYILKVKTVSRRAHHIGARARNFGQHKWKWGSPSSSSLSTVR